MRGKGWAIGAAVSVILAGAAGATDLSGLGLGVGTFVGNEHMDQIFGRLAFHIALDKRWTLGAELKGGVYESYSYHRLYAGLDARYYFAPRRTRAVQGYGGLAVGVTKEVSFGRDHANYLYVRPALGADFPIRGTALSPYIDVAYQHIFTGDPIIGATGEVGLRFDLW